MSFSVMLFSGYMPSSGIVGSYGSFILSVFSSLECLYQFTLPPTVQESFLFSTPSPAFIVYRLFDDGHSDLCEVISHYSFDLNLSNNE